MPRKINRRIEMDSARVSARNYDEALTKALIELGTTSDNVDVEIIERGTNGFLGIIGVKPWTLKVTVKKSVETPVKKKSTVEKTQEKPREQKSPIEKREAEKKETAVEKSESHKTEPSTVEDVHVKKDASEEVESVDEYTRFYGEDEENNTTSRRVLTNDELEEIRDRVDEFLKDFFAAMDLPAHAVYNFSFKTNELSIVIESEEDLGVLIGKRGQTLDSLQYILSLVVNKSSQSYIRIKLDTENYRNKRKDKLELLAKNIAAKVKKTGRFTELEPMNAYERRIIHAALQGDNMVSTKSVGEEPFRHITVYPKRNFKSNKRSPRREIQ